MTDPDNNQLEATWQVRRRLIANEAERKAQGQTIDELVRECRQNRERAQMAHERIDQIEDTSAVLLDVVERLEKLEQRFEKMREWVLANVPRKGNGNGD